MSCKHANHNICPACSMRHTICTWFWWELFPYGLVSFNMDLYDALTHIIQDCFTGTRALIWMFQCQWSNPERYGLIQSVPNHYKAHIVQHDSYASFLYKHSKIYSAYKYYMTYCNVSMCLYIERDWAADLGMKTLVWVASGLYIEGQMPLRIEWSDAI